MKIKLKMSTRMRWVKAMHAAHARRLLPHVLAHPRDKQAAELLTKTLSYTGVLWRSSALYPSSAWLQEHACWADILRERESRREARL